MNSGNPPLATGGVVLTLRSPAHAAPLLAAIKAHPDLTPGDLQGAYLPVAIEAPELRRAHRWLEARPEVVQVEVVFVSMPESVSAPTPLASAS